MDYFQSIVIRKGDDILKRVKKWKSVKKMG